ncbi:MAG: hypothetical protein H6851_15765 [Geminicoccaceae bacterium]|nr:hypothetical protein [Geminicoccaceae bacterium]
MKTNPPLADLVARPLELAGRVLFLGLVQVLRIGWLLVLRQRPGVPRIVPFSLPELRTDGSFCLATLEGGMEAGQARYARKARSYYEAFHRLAHASVETETWPHQALMLGETRFWVGLKAIFAGVGLSGARLRPIPSPMTFLCSSPLLQCGHQRDGPPAAVRKMARSARGSLRPDP